MTDIIGKVKVKLESGRIITHNWSFRNKADIQRWKRDMIGKRIQAIDYKEVKMYGGFGKKGKIISVDEVKSRINKNRNEFKTPTMAELMRM